MSKPERRRLDRLLVERGLCDSREMAKRLVLAGEVKVAGRTVDKAATAVAVDAEITVAERPRYVSRAGLKLEAALDAWGIDPAARVCLDVGASTGGFTDCLLQRGAARVFAFDVGTNQLAWKIRSDARVAARERFNCRHLTASELGEGEARPDLGVVDVSFISLEKILPAMAATLAVPGEVVALVKPQFELARGEVGKGGIVRDDALREKALARVAGFAEAELGWAVAATMPCPVAGTDGNREWLAWFRF